MGKMIPVNNITWHKHKTPISPENKEHVYTEDGMCWCNPEMVTVETEEELIRDHIHLWGLVETPCNLFMHEDKIVSKQFTR